MKELTNVAFAALLVAAASSDGKAALITFDLFPARPVGLEDSATGFLTVDGLTANFSVNSGFMNSTTRGWGINADGFLDDTDVIDGGETVESLTVTFSRDVHFASITLHLVSSADSLQLVMGTNLPVVLSSSGKTLFSANNFIATGESLVISHRTGNGIGLGAFAVETTAVPEPPAVAMLIFGCTGALLAQLRRRAFGRSPVAVA